MCNDAGSPDAGSTESRIARRCREQSAARTPLRPACGQRPGPRCLRPAPIPAAGPAGCNSGAAARRRSLKAAGAVRRMHGGAGRGGRAPRDGSPRRGRGEPSPPHSAGTGDARAGLDHRAPVARRARGAEGRRRRTAGPLAGAPARGKRAAGHPGPGPAMELPGSATGIRTTPRGLRRCCRACLWTPLARCRCAWRPARFSIWALRTAWTRCWPWRSSG